MSSASRRAGTEFGILYKVNSDISVYYSHSTNASPVITNNAPLWRAGEQGEIGFETEWAQATALSAHGAYFEISRTNVTVPRPAFQTDPTQPCRQRCPRPEQQGLRTRARGHDLQRPRPSPASRISRCATASAAWCAAWRTTTPPCCSTTRSCDGSAKGLSVNAGVVYAGERAGDVPDGNFTALGVVKKCFYLQPQYSTTLGFTCNWNEILDAPRHRQCFRRQGFCLRRGWPRLRHGSHDPAGPQHPLHGYGQVLIQPIPPQL